MESQLTGLSYDMLGLGRTGYTGEVWVDEHLPTGMLNELKSPAIFVEVEGDI